MDLFDLVAKITLDSSEYEEGITDAEQKASGFGGKLKTGLGVASKVGIGAVAAIGTASVAAGAAFVKSAGNVAEFGDTIDKESQKLGISSTAYQEWDAILQHTGGSIDSIKPAMKTLAKEAINNSDAFQQLGISQEEVANLSKEEIFAKTITALQDMPEGMERTRLATKLLGRSSVELGALLNTSAEDTEKMRKRVHELGGVMDKRGVKASARYQDSLQDMQTAMSGLSRNLMTDMLPSMATVMDGITEIFAGNSDKGIGLVTNGIDSLVSKIGQKIPKILEIGGRLLTSFSKVISENLPKVIESAVSFVTANLPGAIKGLLTIAVPALISLVGAVAKSMPTLLKGVLTAVSETFTQFLPTIREKGGEILTTIGNGIKGAVGKIPEAIGGIITSIGSWISGNASNITEKGGEILGKIKDGISSAIGTIAEGFSGLVSAVGGWITDHGQDFLSAGENLLNWVVSGIKSFISHIPEALSKIVSFVTKFVTDHGSDFTSAGENLLNWVISGIKSFISKIPDALLGIVSSITSWVTSHSSDFLAAGQNVLSWIIAGIKGWISNIINGFVDFISNVSGWFSDHEGDIKDFGQDVVEYIIEGIKGWISHIKDGFGKVVTTIWNWLNGIIGSLKSIGRDILQKIINGIKDKIKDIGDAFTSLPRKIGNKIRNMASDLMGLGGSIIEKIKNGIKDSGLAAKLIGIVVAAKNAAKRALGSMTDLGTAAKASTIGDEHGSAGHASALYKPYLFNKATVFGRYKGIDHIAGEAGPEMLLGTHALQDMLFTSVQGGMQSMMGQMYDMFKASGAGQNGGSAMLQQEIINVLLQYLPQLAKKQIVLDTGALAGAVAGGVDSALGNTAVYKGRYNA